MPLKKLLICPYFGAFPEWMDLWIADFMRTMKPQGYDLLIDTDLPAFKERVKNKLGIDCPIVRGSGKVWDYRCALGFLYEEELQGYNYWGHVDFDVVWGDVGKFLPDKYLRQVDIYSGHDEYMCGCFSLYRNSHNVRTLFTSYPLWKDKMTSPEPNGWVEQEFSRLIENSKIPHSYNFHQGNPWTDKPILKKEGNSLFQTEESLKGKWIEIMFFHFRRSKRWPLGPLPKNIWGNEIVDTSYLYKNAGPRDI